MKVSLVFPRTKYVSGDPPLGLSYIASYARQRIGNLDINILDSTFHRSLKFIMEGLKSFKPDVVGIFVDTLMYRNAVTVAKFAKELGLFVITGGPHATVCPESLSDVSDIVVRGEGEKAFTKIIDGFNSDSPSFPETVHFKKNHKVLKYTNSCITDLDDFPFPAFDLLDIHSYLSVWNYLDCTDIELKGTTMVTSRGCPYKCSYCQPTLEMLFGPTVRRRTPENVVKEMMYLKERFSINGIFFHDDTFTMDRSWIFKFCDLVNKKNIEILWGCNSRINTIDEDILVTMYNAGLRKMHFGIESGSQRILDNIYNKKIKLNDIEKVLKLTKKIGICTLGFFMIGAPTETGMEINMTVSLAQSLPLDEATFSIATPLLGTFLYDKVRNLPGYEISGNFQDFDYYRNTSITKGGIFIYRLRYFQIKALVMFYLSPIRLRYVLRHLFTLKGIGKLFTKIRRFI